MLAVPLAAISLRCSTSAARAVVKRSHLTLPASQSLSGEAYRIPPSDVGGAICFPLQDGKRAMVITVASGGTAGDVGWAIFVGSGTTWKPVLVRGGYKLGLVQKGADIVETDPIYRKNDANCCPSGGFAHTRWHWTGHQFAVVRTWHDSSYQE